LEAIKGKGGDKAEAKKEGEQRRGVEGGDGGVVCCI